jgi:choline-sulfatase
VYYVGGPPQLFDLAADPEERHDLAEAPGPATAEVLARFEARLRTLLDPEEVDRRAKADQAARVAAFGGREAVLARGTFANSPTPDDKPTWAYPGA